MTKTILYLNVRFTVYLKVITGVKKISVYDPATGTTVQLNNIVPGADAKIKRPIEILDVDNELYYDGDESFLEFSSFTLEGYDQLETWMIANTPVQLVVAGIDYHILWYESAKITVYKNYGFAIGNRNTFNVRISKKRGTHSIYAYTNMLRTNGKWEDDDVDEKADCLTFSGGAGVTYDFNNDIQTITTGASTNATADIIFPFSGINIVSALNRQSGNGWTIKVRALNYASSIIGTSESTVFDNVTLLLPANTYKIRWEVAIGISSGSVLFKLPFIGSQRGNYLDINY